VNVTEEPIVFNCVGSRLLGILHRPASSRDRAVLIVVGGPQYRVGSHRQFLHLARDLADEGTPVLRFDYRGMGDSDGEMITFEETRCDIRAAIDLLYERIPELTDVVIWGLCDAASAALLYACHDARVSGLVLANPWVRTDESIARTYMQHYYRSRWLDPGLWKRLLTGQVDIVSRMSEFWQTFRATRRSPSLSADSSALPETELQAHDLPYTERMLLGLEQFTGRVLLITSGEDLVAAEFSDHVAASDAWQAALHRPGVQRQVFAEANHTFSRQAWRDQVAGWTDKWLKSW
jgi:uncharacterized protein